MKRELIKSLQNMSEEKIIQVLDEEGVCPDDFYLAREHTCDFYKGDKGDKGCVECWKNSKSKF